MMEQLHIVRRMVHQSVCDGILPEMDMGDWQRFLFYQDKGRIRMMVKRIKDLWKDMSADQVHVLDFVCVRGFYIQLLHIAQDQLHWQQRQY